LKSPAIWLLKNIVESFPPASQIERERERESNFCLRQKSLFTANCGLPIGNLTSQLFANIYLNEFDYFVKHELKIKHYLRYTDDFVIVDKDENKLVELLPVLKQFLAKKLKLELHPNKVKIRKFSQGVDFLGYVVLPNRIQLRTKTKRRIFSKMKLRVKEYRNGKIGEYTLEQSLNSYLGTMSHANSFQTQEELKNKFWFWLSE